MATPFLNGADLVGIPLLHLRLENLAAAPSSPYGPGHMYFSTASLSPNFYNGTTWINILARSSQTGTQPSATISDLSTVVQSYTLDLFAAPAANLNFNSKRVTNAADPVNPQDLATMNYVLNLAQSSAAGISSKDPVRAISVANLSLTGAATVDGVVLNTGDRVLATAQTTGSQNGPWIVNTAGSWSRPTTEGATQWELDKGALWLATEGSTYAGSQWRLNNTGTITPGTTAITIVQFSAGLPISAGNGILNASGNLSINVKSGGGLTVDNTGLYLTANYSFSTGFSNNSNVITFNAKAGGGLTADATGVYLTTPISAGAGLNSASGVLSVNAKAAGGIIADNTGTYLDTTVAARKFSAIIGDGSTLAYTVTHNLNTRNIICSIVTSAAPYNLVEADVAATTVNSSTITFASAPSSGQYIVVIMG